MFYHSDGTVMYRLFQKISVILASGRESDWKANVDEVFDAEDWWNIAAIVAPRIPPFGHVIPVPTGGTPFALALSGYTRADSPVTMIADDVWTTGGSMLTAVSRYKDESKTVGDIRGVVVFARGPIPKWVDAFWIFGLQYDLPTCH